MMDEIPEYSGAIQLCDLFFCRGLFFCQEMVLSAQKENSNNLQ